MCYKTGASVNPKGQHIERIIPLQIIKTSMSWLCLL